MKPLKLGNMSMVSQGDQVVAIGSPEGFQNTVSDGIVSGLRTIGDINVIQITAPITHGSSGGPLFNMQGYVVGINSLGMDSGNLNFAIDANYAAGWIRELSSQQFDQIQVQDSSVSGTPAVQQTTGTTGGPAVYSASKASQVFNPDSYVSPLIKMMPWAAAAIGV